jgi:hypothetical protein
MCCCESPFSERGQRRLRASVPDPVGVSLVVLVLAIGLVVSVHTAGTVAVDDERAAAAASLDEHSDGGDTVLSWWDAHRLYNDHASGDGHSYRLANEHYGEVVAGEQSPPGDVDWLVVERERAASDN